MLVFYKIIICINFSRCVESGVSYLSSKVDRIIEASNGQSLVECENNIVIPCRYSGKSLYDFEKNLKIIPCFKLTNVSF